MKYIPTITIPKTLIKEKDLIIVPRRKYEEILRLAKKRITKDWLYEEPFVSELKKRVAIAEKELKTSKVIAWQKS